MWFSRFMASDKRHVLKESVGVYVLHTKDIAVSRRIYIGMNDEYLKAVKAIEWIKKLRGAGWLPMLLDIGANIGHISIPLLLGRYVGEAIAIEPAPDNFKLLSCNVILNGLDKDISVRNLALGALPEETLDFELSEDNFGDHRVRVSGAQGALNEADRKVLTVRSTNLDSMRELEGRSSDLLLWIDVQGYEGAVLSGASALLKNKPAIGMEFWPYGLHRAKTSDALFRALSVYEVFYDLNSPQPVQLPISSLKGMYEENKLNDGFYIDIVLA